jgi:hypothetical protein
VKNRALRTLAIMAVTIAMSGIAFVDIPSAQVGTVGGPGGAGSGSGSTGGGGDGAGAASASGLPGDTRLAGIDQSGVFVASSGPVTFSRRTLAAPAAGMTLAQERTWDAFHQCATRGAVLDQLRFDGSFTFEAASRSDVYAIESCMTRMGFSFDR